MKPANLLYASLARGAPLKIVDFGLAASVEDTGDEPRPWVLRGTPGYMAPELVTDGVEIDRRFGTSRPNFDIL